MTQQSNNGSSKAASNQKQYYCYEIVGDNTAKTNSRGAGKDVFVKKIPVRGITLTIGVFFDGTGNNAANTAQRLLQFDQCNDVHMGHSEEYRQSCQQYMADTIGNTSYNNYYSNIHWLNLLYKPNRQILSEQIEAQIRAYIPGIGTEDGKQDSLLGLGLGSSILADFNGVVTKTDDALEVITASIAEFIENNQATKFVIAKLQFDLFGFSRGAAAARHFANRVQAQDKAIIAAVKKGLGLVQLHGKLAGENRFIGLFDTVAAIGSFRNFYDIHGPHNPGVNLELPPNIAQSVFQITAQHECRYNFSLNSIKSVWPELALPGVHADIGGSYNPTEREYRFLTLPIFETLGNDMPETAMPIYHKTEATRKTLLEHPNLRFQLAHANVKTSVRAVRDLMGEKRHGGIQKRVGAAVIVDRVVTNDWSKVCLRVMLDAAQEAGAIFTPIKKDDADLQITPELQPYCDKAIAQGKAVRNGEEHFGFPTWDLETIGKYLHCSAHWEAVGEDRIWIDPIDNKIHLRRSTPAPEKTIAYPHQPNRGWNRAIWPMYQDQFEQIS